jgi:hypothetical protein
LALSEEVRALYSQANDYQDHSILVGMKRSGMELLIADQEIGNARPSAD